MANIIVKVVAQKDGSHKVQVVKGKVIVWERTAHTTGQLLVALEQAAKIRSKGQTI